MVFTPLTFMAPDQALLALDALIGDRLMSAVRGRAPISHEVHLWPQGLKATSWSGDEPSRCEPDLVVRFEFSRGDPVLVVGEMKWEWFMSPKALSEEVGREIVAVRSAWPGTPVPFVLSKYRYDVRPGAYEVLSWSDAANRLRNLERSSAGAAGRWACLVREFLAIADVRGFGGFPTPPIPIADRANGSAFWRAADV